MLHTRLTSTPWTFARSGLYEPLRARTPTSANAALARIAENFPRSPELTDQALDEEDAGEQQRDADQRDDVHVAVDHQFARGRDEEQAARARDSSHYIIISHARARLFAPST